MKTNFQFKVVLGSNDFYSALDNLSHDIRGWFDLHQSVIKFPNDTVEFFAGKNASIEFSLKVENANELLLKLLDTPCKMGNNAHTYQVGVDFYRKINSSDLTVIPTPWLDVLEKAPEEYPWILSTGYSCRCGKANKRKGSIIVERLFDSYGLKTWLSPYLK